jgi:hypothetical protein
MKKYVIFCAGLDYNDEIYCIGGGGGGVDKDGFNTLDEAKIALREKYMDMMKPHRGSYDYSYSVGEFSYDREEKAWVLVEELFDHADDYAGWSGPHYHELITKCEENNINWLPFMPDIYEIVEVIF